jgi:hypothetical protein
MGVTAALATMPWKGVRLGHSIALDNPICSKVLKNRMFRGATPIDEDSVEFCILDDGADDERIPPRLWHKVRVVTVVKGDGDLGPL